MPKILFVTCGETTKRPWQSLSLKKNLMSKTPLAGIALPLADTRLGFALIWALTQLFRLKNSKVLRSMSETQAPVSYKNLADALFLREVKKFKKARLPEYLVTAFIGRTISEHCEITSIECSQERG